MNLGGKIRQFRLKAGLTQEQLAERLGITAQSVSKWENAVAMPDITMLPLIAEDFGVSIDDLFDLTTEQRLNRIENRMDAEEELPQDVFREYEDFLEGQLGSPQHGKRATELINAKQQTGSACWSYLAFWRECAATSKCRVDLFAMRQNCHADRDRA